MAPKFLAKTPYSFPILYDDLGIVQKRYGVFKFPESFIVGNDGRVVEKIIGPILASILMVAATSGQVGEGIGLLSVYSLGLGVPFLLSGLLFHQFMSAFKRFRKHIRLIEICTGVMLMAVGIMLMFSLLGPITMFFYRFIPVQG